MIRRRLVATLALAAAMCGAQACAAGAAGDEAASAGGAGAAVTPAAPALWEPIDPSFTGCEGG